MNQLEELYKAHVNYKAIWAFVYPDVIVVEKREAS
jgi:hypothetical protein